MTLTIFIIGSYIKGVIKWENMVAIDGRQVGFYIFFQLQVSTLGYGFQLHFNIIIDYKKTFDLISAIE